MSPFRGEIVTYGNDVAYKVRYQLLSQWDFNFIVA